jgi:methionyl-tRNA formyltransferase
VVHATHGTSSPPPFGSLPDDRLLAIRNGAPGRHVIIAQPEELAAHIAPLRLDVLVCHGYPKLLPPDALASTTHGVVNLHSSDLPRHRGACPVQWALLQGDPTIRTTAHLMTDTYDQGPILAQSDPIELPDWFDPHSLHRNIIDATLKLAPRALDAIAARTPGRAQNEADATYVGALDKGMCRLDRSRSARDIHNQARMLHYIGWPALTEIDSAAFRVMRTRLTPGTVRIPCATGDLWADQVIPLDRRSPR